MADCYAPEIEHALKGITVKFKDCYLAGGAITSTFTGKNIRDYDLYFKNEESFKCAVKRCFEEGFWCVALTKRAITFIEDNTTVYQLMFFDWFDTADKIFQKFDFTVCMAAIDLNTNEFSKDKNFIRDIAKRKIRFNHLTEFPIGSALRVRKYVDRGYSIENEEYLKVLMACAFRSPKDWDDLKNQIGGQYGEAVSIDTSKEFTLDNAISSLCETLYERPDNVSQGGAESYDDAIKQIFG